MQAYQEHRMGFDIQQTVVVASTARGISGVFTKILLENNVIVYF